MDVPHMEGVVGRVEDGDVVGRGAVGVGVGGVVQPRMVGGVEEEVVSGWGNRGTMVSGGVFADDTCSGVGVEGDARGGEARGGKQDGGRCGAAVDVADFEGRHGGGGSLAGGGG